MLKRTIYLTDKRGIYTKKGHEVKKVTRFCDLFVTLANPCDIRLKCKKVTRSRGCQGNTNLTTIKPTNTTPHPRGKIGEGGYRHGLTLWARQNAYDRGYRRKHRQDKTQPLDPCFTLQA